ncbi:unnamed protein product [Chrysodeixis includens]|nr:unnamed protein product [Chrysodeixis includens]
MFLCYRFPTNDDLRKRWVEATGRGKWSPADDNYICSRHFRDNDYFIKRSGKRYLKNGAIPCEYIVYANLYPDNFPVPSPEVAEEPEPVPAENPANPEQREDEFVELNTESDDDSEAASWDQLHALVNSAQDLHAQQGAGVHPAFREIQRIITKRKSYTRKD